MLISAGKLTLEGADRVSIDDVAELIDYLEAEGEAREKRDARERREAEARSAQRTQR